jgi:hypothetical protein
VADNIRLGKEEEEAPQGQWQQQLRLQRKGVGGDGWGGRGGRRGRGLFDGPRHSN